MTRIFGFCGCKMSDILYLGVIHQRRPSKNWLFGHTPPPSTEARTVARIKTSETQNWLQSGRPWTGGVGLQYELPIRQKNLFVNVWLMADPHPPRLSEVVHVRIGTLSPLLTGRLWWMAPYVSFVWGWILSVIWRTFLLRFYWIQCRMHSLTVDIGLR